MGLLRKLSVLFVLSGIFFCYSQIPSFYEHNKYLLTSPGAMGIGLYGYDNPALLSYLHQFDLEFIWSDELGEWNDFDKWALFTAIPHFGFSVNHRRFNEGSITNYNISTALGNKKQSLGIGYEWSKSDAEILTQPAVWKIGWLSRPVKFFSLGIVGSFASSKGDREGYIDAGIRPLGNEKLTLFVDYAIHRGTELKDAPWSTGIVIEPLQGIRFTARYFNDHSFTAGMSFSFGRIGVINQLHFDTKQQHQHNTYGFRLGAYDRNIFRPLRKKYLELNLNGTLHYQRYILFDKSNTLLSLLKVIDCAKNDPAINGIAINTSGMDINVELLWELREKLKDFKSADKHIIVYIDEADMLTYYLATIADFIVIDPEGAIALPGLLMGRMYFKNALDKLGIGVDEWRFFKYKSAAEALSRDKMSDPDREQRQAIIDDFYNTLKNDICAIRKFTLEQFDELVDEENVLLPRDALEKKLVDKIGRWEEVKEAITSLEGKKRPFVSAQHLEYFQLPKDNYWGEKSKIAIIYGIGECAMDTGIKARSLVKDFEWATERKDIKAVVFRVDSPGGSALASDIIAEAIKKCQKKKPVIVTQGAVAGSGGYWLSMYGNTIIASPFTITGSIGVIGVWLYNKELKEKLGFSTDFVKRGEHADLGFGFVFPFIGQLPDRNLTDIEKNKMERMIKTLYKEFVSKVADGRHMKKEEVEEIAQGRVWSGTDGKHIGLIDTLGGLETAIMIAREKAGIPKDAEVTIVELPKPQLFSPDILQPKLINTNNDYIEFIRYLKFFSEHNGDALLIMPLEQILTINK